MQSTRKFGVYFMLYLLIVSTVAEEESDDEDPADTSVSTNPTPLTEASKAAETEITLKEEEEEEGENSAEKPEPITDEPDNSENSDADGSAANDHASHEGESEESSDDQDEQRSGTLDKDTLETVNCFETTERMTACWEKDEQPKCNNDTMESHITSCMNRIYSERFEQCHLEIMRRSQERMIETFQTSDKFMCKPDNLRELQKDGCWEIAKLIAFSVAKLVKDFQRYDKCAFEKMQLENIIAEHKMEISAECETKLEDYAEMMFQASPCKDANKALCNSCNLITFSFWNLILFICILIFIGFKE